MKKLFGANSALILKSFGENKKELAAGLFYFLRDFDRQGPDVILATGVDEKGLGLAIMNRMRKAAGQQSLVLRDGRLLLRNGAALPPWLSLE